MNSRRKRKQEAAARRQLILCIGFAAACAIGCVALVALPSVAWAHVGSVAATKVVSIGHWLWDHHKVILETLKDVRTVLELLEELSKK